MLEVLKGATSASKLLEWENQILTGYPANARPLKFTENHDLPRTVSTFGADRFKPFAAFNFFVPGIPLIYNGQELGLKDEISLFDRDVIDWSDKNTDIYRFYRRLIEVRYGNISVFNSKLKVISNVRAENVVVFIRADSKDNLLIILNFGDEMATISTDLPGLADKTITTDLMSGDRIDVNNKYLDVKANQVMVLKG
jgi:glycosidase